MRFRKYYDWIVIVELLNVLPKASTNTTNRRAFNERCLRVVDVAQTRNSIGKVWYNKMPTSNMSQ